MTVNEPLVTALGAPVHLLVLPEARARFISLFRGILQCVTKELAFGLTYSILLVSFSDGSAFSVKFSDRAAEEPTGETVEDETPRRSA